MTETEVETQPVNKFVHPFRTFRQGPNDKAPVEVPTTEMPEGVFRVEDPRTDEQILKGVVPAPLTDEQKNGIYEKAKQAALIDYHLTRCKAIIGNPEGFSLDEIEKMSDLFPAKTLSFMEWWKIRLARETEAMKTAAQQS
jgi:hypothetical protein